MDAAKYLEEKKRMCESAERCDEDSCPMYSCKGCASIELLDPAEAVRIVEIWSKEHPIKIEVGDEVYLHGVRGVVTRLYTVGSDSEELCGILYQSGSFASSALKSLKKTGRHFQCFVEMLEKMNEE